MKAWSAGCWLTLIALFWLSACGKQTTEFMDQPSGSSPDDSEVSLPTSEESDALGVELEPDLLPDSSIDTDDQLSDEERCMADPDTIWVIGPSGEPVCVPRNPGDDSEGPGQPQPGPPVDSVAPDLIRELCTDLDKAIIKTTRLEFPSTRECKWNENGNLAKRDRYFQAISTQEGTVSLPDGYAVCEMQMQSATSNLRYDDYLILTAEDYVVLSTNDGLLAGPISDENVGIWRKWEFDDIKGSVWGEQNVTCFGISDQDKCVAPGHDTQGELDLVFEADELSDLSSVVYDRRKLSVKLSIFGDNDEQDCEHTGVSLDVRLKMVLVQD